MSSMPTVTELCLPHGHGLIVQQYIDRWREYGQNETGETDKHGQVHSTVITHEAGWFGPTERKDEEIYERHYLAM
jgi:hypothetical protein